MCMHIRGRHIVELAHLNIKELRALKQKQKKKKACPERLGLNIFPRSHIIS